MSSLDAAALAVPKGSLVLVTGANGLVGSHIADQYLYYGYKVRGTARDTDKNAWLVDFFRARYGEDSFELFKVPDMNAEGAYDDAVKGRPFLRRDRKGIFGPGSSQARFSQASPFSRTRPPS